MSSYPIPIEQLRTFNADFFNIPQSGGIGPTGCFGGGVAGLTGPPGIGPTGLTGPTPPGMMGVTGPGSSTGPTGSVVTAGKVVQVVANTYIEPLNSTSAYTIVSAVITPAANTNKVLVLLSANDNNDESRCHCVMSLKRNATFIYNTPSGYFIWGQGQSTTSCQTITAVYLDSPATTSAITYSVTLADTGGQGHSNNRSINDTDNSTYGRSATSITLLELLP